MTYMVPVPDRRGKLLLLVAMTLSGSGWADPPQGEAIYKKRCAGCHEQTSERIPHRASLRKMAASRIMRSLDFGAMMNIAYPMSRQERQAVASWLGTAETPKLATAAYCSDRTVRIS